MHEQHARDFDRTSALLDYFCSSSQLLFDLFFPIPAQGMKAEFLMQHPYVLSIELTLATHVPMAKLSNSLKPCSRVMNLKVASCGF